MQLWLSIRDRFVLCLTAVDQELSFQDKFLFYRFLEDETEDAPLPTEEDKKESDEELQDTLLLLSQIGPDAHLRMILSKLYVLPQKQQLLLIWVITSARGLWVIKRSALEWSDLYLLLFGCFPMNFPTIIIVWKSLKAD